MASASYKINENLSGYITFSTGWLAGGYDHFSGTSQDSFSYDAENTNNYEAGLKTSFFKKRLKADISVFYTDIDDKQIKETVPGGVGLWKFTNAAKAHTKGFEFELTATPFNCMEMFASAGYAATEIDDWTGVAGGAPIDYSGNSHPWSPGITCNAGAGYYMQNGLYCIADIFYAGKQYFDAANTLEEKGYFLCNIKTGYRHKKFDISIWGKIIFDEEYVTKKVRVNTGNTLVEDGEPLTFGITLDWRL